MLLKYYLSLDVLLKTHRNFSRGKLPETETLRPADRKWDNPAMS
jgi:hypothetical protein